MLQTVCCLIALTGVVLALSQVAGADAPMSRSAAPTYRHVRVACVSLSCVMWVMRIRVQSIRRLALPSLLIEAGVANFMPILTQLVCAAVRSGGMVVRVRSAGASRNRLLR